jgi:hypothetical protein
VDPCRRRTKPPIGDIGTPEGAPGEREIEFLRLMRMVGIFGLRPEQEHAAGDAFAYERAALADPFVIAVVFQEALAEIGARIGLPPVEFAGQRLDRLDKGAGLGRRQARQALQSGHDGKRARANRPRTSSDGQSRKKASACGPAVSSNARRASTSECRASLATLIAGRLRSRTRNGHRPYKAGKPLPRCRRHGGWFDRSTGPENGQDPAPRLRALSRRMRSARNRRPVSNGPIAGIARNCQNAPGLNGNWGNAPMKKLVAIAVLGVVAGAAGGCQTPEQSSMQASNVCMASGLHPGTHAYQRCYAANYTNLRANSQQAENAAVAGAALGVAGGALAGAAIANSNGYYYGGYGPGWGYGWGPRCGWGGCW